MGIADVLGLAGTVAENWRNANDARRASYLYELEREQAARLDALRQLELQQDVYANAPPDIGVVNYAPGQDFIEVAQQQQMMQNALASAGAPTAVPLAPLQQGAQANTQGRENVEIAPHLRGPDANADLLSGNATPFVSAEAYRAAAPTTVGAVRDAKAQLGAMLGGSPEEQQRVLAQRAAIEQLERSPYYQNLATVADAVSAPSYGFGGAPTTDESGRALQRLLAQDKQRGQPAKYTRAKSGEGTTLDTLAARPAPQDTQQAAAQDPLAAAMQMINGGQQAAPAPAQVQAPAAPQPQVPIGSQITLPSGTRTVLYQPPQELLATGNPLYYGMGLVESRFDTTALSPKGAAGVMQLMPDTAIGMGLFQRAGVQPTGDKEKDKRLAQDILRQNTALNIQLGVEYINEQLQASGGNAVDALIRYNYGPGNYQNWKQRGGDWNQLPPETQNYVKDVLAVAAAYGGSQAFPNMPAPLLGVEQVAPSIAEQSPAVQMDRSQFYLANPASVPRDLQVAVQQRQDMARMANLYRQAGLGHEYMQAAMQVRAADQQIVQLQGMQGISELTFANDPRRLSAIWSQYAGTPVQVVPRSDGKWDIRVNGQTTQQGKTTDEVVKVARSMVDQSYNAAMTKEQLEWQKAVLDNQTKVQMEHIKGQYSVMNNDADNLRELQKQAMSNESSLRVAQQQGVNTLGNTWFQHMLQAQQPQGGRSGASVHNLGDGGALIFDPGGARTAVITPQTDANGNPIYVQQQVLQRPPPM